MRLPRDWKYRLRKHEESVSYNSPAFDGHPFKLLPGAGKVMVSAPHGARSFRNTNNEVWHEEDEYTVGFSLLLHDLLNVPVIVSMFRNDVFDPNYHNPNAYKDALSKFTEENQIRYVLDLHGAALQSKHLYKDQLVDLGAAGIPPKSIDARSFSEVRTILERYLGKGSTERKDKEGFNADENNRTITNYLYNLGRVNSLQIEMKPQVRILERLESASLFKSYGRYKAKPIQVKQALLALAEIIELLDQKQ